jgi:hypothetical protein
MHACREPNRRRSSKRTHYYVSSTVQYIRYVVVMMRSILRFPRPLAAHHHSALHCLAL